MHRSALRGCLIAALLCAAGASADSREEGACDGPECERVAHPGPAVEGQSYRKAPTSDQPSEPAPLPVRIVQSPADAEHAQAQEQEAREHEAEDLAAQQKAADSAAVAATAADRQVYAAWAAAVLTAIGTGLLVWTLAETRKTAKAAIAGVHAAERAAVAAEQANAIAAAAAKDAVEAAVQANRISRDAYLAEQRPWLSVDHVPRGALAWADTHCFLDIAVILRNSGKTPALRTRVKIRAMPDANVAMFPRRQHDLSDELLSDREHRPEITVFPGKEETYVLSLDAESSEVPIGRPGRSGHTATLYGVQFRVVGCVQYSSPGEEGTVHQTGFMFSVHAQDGGRFVLTLTPEMGEIPKERLRLERWPYQARVF